MNESFFRRIRKPFGFRISLSVLITAEIIAMTYYRALRGGDSLAPAQGHLQ